MKRDTPKFILITGIDGSGKTTLAKNLVTYLEKYLGEYNYVHANEVPVLMRLVKMSIKFIFLRKHDAFKDYSDYTRKKQNISREYLLLGKLYRILMAIDYIPQVFFKIYWPLLLGRKLIVDRYVYDVVINLGLNLNYSSYDYIKEINIFFKIFPKPDICFLLDIDEHVAFSRKDDVPSVEYLKERKKIYNLFAEKGRMEVIECKGTSEAIAEFIARYVIEIQETRL